MKRNNEHLSLSEVLKEFVHENKLEKGLNKVHVRDAWESQMGPAIKKYTTNIQLKKTTLYVQLSSSVLRQELSYGKEKIIHMLNKELKEELIKKLVLC